LEVPSLKLLGIILIISFGVMLTGNFSLLWYFFYFRSLVLGNFQLVWSGFFFFQFMVDKPHSFATWWKVLRLVGFFYYYWADTNPLLQLQRRQSFSLRASFLWCCPQLWLALVGLWHSFFCRYIMIVAQPSRWWLCSFRKWRHCCRSLENIFFCNH
jgi:hypothetical protein